MKTTSDTHQTQIVSVEALEVEVGGFTGASFAAGIEAFEWCVGSVAGEEAQVVGGNRRQQEAQEIIRETILLQLFWEIIRIKWAGGKASRFGIFDTDSEMMKRGREVTPPTLLRSVDE